MLLLSGAVDALFLESFIDILTGANVMDADLVGFGDEFIDDSIIGFSVNGVQRA